MKKIIWGCATDKGKYRKKNQDRIFCWNGSGKQKSIFLTCVCDGVGSFEYGELAADMVVNGLCLWVESVVDQRLQHLSEPELAEDLFLTLHELNELIYEKQMTEKIRLGCTMSVLLVLTSRYYVFHVGDSRIYRLSKTIKQLTVDEVAVSKKDGKLRLTNCVGKEKTIHICRENGALVSEDTYILGSDGLFHKLVLEEVQNRTKKIIDNQQMRQLCRTLIDEVEEKGEKDNISCIIVKIAEKDETGEVTGGIRNE